MTRPHKGNKQSLPSKPCAVCGRPMTWRKKWAKNWDDVKFCSDACRKKRGASDAATVRS
jgi:hypothetical protein